MWTGDGWCEGLESDFPREGLYHYAREFGYANLLCDSIPAGPELTTKEVKGLVLGKDYLTVYRHAPGNLTAKRDMNPAPYPRHDVVFTTSTFDADLRELFWVGSRFEVRHFLLVGNTVYVKGVLDGLPDLERQDEGAYLMVQHAIRSTLERLNSECPVVLVYLRERDSWNVFRAVESLKGSRIRCVAAECGGVYLDGEAEKGWAERFGWVLKSRPAVPAPAA